MKTLLCFTVILCLASAGFAEVKIKLANGETRTYKEVEVVGNLLVGTLDDGTKRNHSWRQLAEEEIAKYFPDRWNEMEAQKKGPPPKLPVEEDPTKKVEHPKTPEPEAKPEIKPPEIAMLAVPEDAQMAVIQKAIHNAFISQPSLQSKLHKVVVRKGYIEAVVIPTITPKTRDDLLNHTVNSCRIILQALADARINAQQERIIISVWTMVHSAASRPEAPLMTPVARAVYDPLVSGVFFQETHQVFGLESASR